MRLPVCGATGRRGRRPLRLFTGKRCVGVGVPDDPHRACTAASRQGTQALPYKNFL